MNTPVSFTKYGVACIVPGEAKIYHKKIDCVSALPAGTQ